MTIIAILLITLSAFTHAGWNVLCKSKTTSAAFFLHLTVLSLLAFCPSFFMYRDVFAKLPGIFWIIVILTGFFQTVYYVTLARAYLLSEVSVAYPMARSIPVILVPAATLIFGFGTPPGIAAFIGMFLIFCGCLILPQKSFSGLFRAALYKNAGFLTVLVSAVFIAAYSIADREALRILGEDDSLLPGKIAISFFYSGLECVSILLFLTPYALIRKDERKETVRIVREMPWTPVLAALMCSGGYLLVLTAMQFVSNVSYIVAFRQLSIPIGAAMGVLLLHETLSAPKITGLALILAGLVLTALF